MGALRPGYEVTPELTLVRRLGAGGMGTVWLANHNKLRTEVVVKFLSEALASDPEACTRFEREVVATLQVRSPHVVQTLDHGITESGIPFLVLEWLEGHDLAKELRARGPLPPDEVMHVIEGISTALTKAHERGIVHRDIKPANVFLVTGSPRPFVKLVDFGIAKRLEDETMTATNALLGTPAYMSPEQMDGSLPIDHRTDLWALGVLAYHMLVGRPPFKGAHIAHIAHAILHGERPKISTDRPELPLALDAWIDRALARDPAHRFDSARELADTLAAAFGDVAFTTNRRNQMLLGTGPHQPPIPRGSASFDIPVTIGSTATTIVRDSGLPKDSVGVTLGASAITHSPYGSSPRLKWWVMLVAAIGVVLVGLSFKVGYGYHATPPPPVQAATQTPPDIAPPPPAPVSVLPPPPAPPPAVAPVVSSAAPPIVMVPAAPPAKNPNNPRRTTGPGRPAPPHKNGTPEEPDSIGF